MNTLGEFLKSTREEAGYSLKDVADKIGITDSRLSRMEHDAMPCPASEIRKLAELYHISVISLYLKAGYLTRADLSEYQTVFRDVSSLTDEEKNHVQQCIDLLTRRKAEI